MSATIQEQMLEELVKIRKILKAIVIVLDGDIKSRAIGKEVD